ncbi:MoaD/ThiS family protein [Thermosphaera chiliense]|uniref:MoaD/ThiS family protein n=1 Tax=Thermosphaera chiliense TaxID=3402707 RepID=A0A7M1UTW7_9CREN|nr:MoaD/ThiS family protein [Thermosphaera aggregans]QOR94334.1 MoaD/ThiS family protein [Thermosphaera aggregans]
MTIIVRLYGALKDVAGREVLALEPKNHSLILIDLIKEILRIHPPLNEFITIRDERIEVKGLTILVNGRHVMFLGGDTAVVNDGDVVDILPPLHGG